MRLLLVVVGVTAVLWAQTADAYIESVAASVNSKTKNRQHQRFLPLVAFKCGYRNKYVKENGEWVDDTDRYATCLTGKLDILKYCRKVYPKLEVTNIVEYSHETKLTHWCKEEGKPCKWTHQVRPFQCIVGKFQSEALQVPHGCRFGHVDDQQVCDDYKHWEKKAHSRCELKPRDGQHLTVLSFSVLEPCGLDLFSGVEYVCCPVAGSKQIEDKVSTQEKSEEFYDEDEDDDEYDEYDDDDSYSDEEEADEDSKPDPDEVNSQDPYFRLADPDNEHQNYKDALDRLERKHREKVAKVMREWSELDTRYKAMKEKDPNQADQFKREMTGRFQKTVKALEDENKELKTQLEDVHQERVQAALNERKRETTRKFRDALAKRVDGDENKHQVLKTLKAYIRAEEKDREHMLNHYRHQLKKDAKAAENDERPKLLRRLRDIDLRINGTLAMLRDFPALDDKVTPIALEYWLEVRKENTPAVSNDDLVGIDGHHRNEQLIELYKEQYERIHHDKEIKVEIEPIVDTRPQPMVAHEVLHRAENDRSNSYRKIDTQQYQSPAAVDHGTSSSWSFGSTHGVLLGVACAAVLIALLGVVLARRRRRHSGFIEVDVCTPEERHVNGMQVTGYENPTYSFFDKA